jgi:radical SAM protein with 4Fe4S-binding SPASM domain
VTSLVKKRREWFGGVVYSENPGFTAFVDSRCADRLGIPSSCNLTDGLFSAPLDVHLSITNRCNLLCRGCYARSDDEPIKDMPLDLAQEIIDRLSDMDVFTVALGGGEPFLHPQLFDIAAYARGADIVPNVTTNGLLIDANTAAKCRVFGSVHVSCHHPAELARLAEPVRLLKCAGMDVGMNVLISSATFDELPLIWSWCAREGISRVLMLKFKLTENNHECQDMVLSSAQEQSLLALMRRLSRRHSIMPMLDCSFFPALAYTLPDRSDLEFFDVNGCVGGNSILAVTMDGQFKPCSFCRTTYGDACQLSRNVWKESRELEEFRHWRFHSGCEVCTYGDLCNGGCRISETQCCQTGLFSGPDNDHRHSRSKKRQCSINEGEPWNSSAV